MLPKPGQILDFAQIDSIEHDRDTILGTTTAQIVTNQGRVVFTNPLTGLTQIGLWSLADYSTTLVLTPRWTVASWVFDSDATRSK